MKRRSFIKMGFASTLAAAIGLPLAARLASGKKAAPAATAKAKACIFLYATGGPSQIDTFDPKPDSDNSGGVNAIATSVAGIQIAERLPKLATIADRLAIVRSIVSKEGNHARARHYMHTGYVPAGGVRHPGFGAITSMELGAGPLPSYISIGGPGADAGFLGAAHSPFAIKNPKKEVANIKPFKHVDEERFDARTDLIAELDAGFAARHPDSTLLQNQQAVTDKAIAMMKSTEVVAFDTSKESKRVRDLYGPSAFGTGCLMARRLISSGVTFVEVMHGGWDTHSDHDDRMQTLCGDLDQGMTALLLDLESHGLLESTLVVWIGDFGRTPKLNGRGGRDHYPRVTPAVFAGGGGPGGQVVGATDADGENVIDGETSVPDVFATMATLLGIDPDVERKSRAGRPFTTVDMNSRAIASITG
jgi:hypothetical protein